MSKDKNKPLESRLNFALKSSEIAKNIKNDSILLLAHRNLSLMYFHTEEYDKYVSLNRSNFKLAQKLQDSSAITVATSNLGSFYRYLEKNDSSYYFYSKALKFYPKNEISEAKATALLYLADIQQIEKIHAGAEEAAIQSILILNQLPETQNKLSKLWDVYNLMGIISRELGNYPKSIEYYDKSNEYAKRIDDGFINEVYSINNKAFVYRKMGDFKKAIELYESLIPLRSRYEEQDPAFYPAIIANIADIQLEFGNYDFDTVKNKFEEAYAMGEKLDDEFLKMNVALDLSKLYKEIDQRDSISKYANEAYEIATNASANELRQEALLMLSEIDDGEKGKFYLKEHIRLTDSLLDVERKVRDKFARIKYDTDTVEQENARMSQQLMWLLAISGGLLVTLFLLYIIITQRSKNKELKFEKDQQKANEEIYNLMLSQQDKVDEARAGEKKRISEELHDGVLGRLFGTRLSLDSLNFSEGKEAVQNRSTYIKELMTIENDIRKISHDLNTDFVSGSRFMDIVSELIEKQIKAYQLGSSFNYTDDINWEVVPNKTKINIYRIIQESLQNIYKHANAKAVNISIQLKNNVICLVVIDDGEGFDVNKSKKGIGIKNINSRVNEVEGTAEFNSIINKGTEVSITIPYKN
ncbi:MAG: tetratricopeptide repeat protein [Psychroserpens sp.]|uniref:tetratricopeptide repeat-containing sensor histidine kinase n=1 Tax=Psychroserpens sp. TaxID=2020870 RepID=UPI0030030920